MGRGQTADVGATRVANNGYHYTKTKEGWVLTHHLTAEKLLGRPLDSNEIVKFKAPKFKRDPHNPDGIKVIKKKTSSLRRRKAVVEDKIRELQAELNQINKELRDL